MRNMPVPALPSSDPFGKGQSDGAGRIPCAASAQSSRFSAGEGRAQNQAIPDMQSLPCWFGKLPGMGDFAYRRLPVPFRESWDCWLQDGLAGLRMRHAGDWTEHYLKSPLWCFALGQGAVDTGNWIGVLMPSVDGVGRYFPFMLARQFDASINTADWWACAVGAALDALDADLDAERFEVLLAQRFGQTGALGEDTPPPPGQTWWRTDLEDGTSLRFACAGLPLGAQFDALFGFALPQELSR